jgi:hypothetical protein
LCTNPTAIVERIDKVTGCISDGAEKGEEDGVELVLG